MFGLSYVLGVYKLSYLGIIETHSSENPTVCPVSPGFELMTSCI